MSAAACACFDPLNLSLIPMERSAVAISCTEHANPQTFFDGIPWLNVPISRRARFTVEALHLQRGLLGGSSKGEKMSKLAALAAKRRQKENAQPMEAKVQNTIPEDLPSGLNSLQLSSQVSIARSVSVSNPTPIGVAATRPSSIALSAGHKSANPIDDSSPSSCKPEPQCDPQHLKAPPSAFASTILGPSPSKPRPNLESTIGKSLLDDEAQGFDFTAPSPDDVVIRAQAAKGPR